MGREGLLFGLVEHGVVQAPLGPDISGPRLVAAVANAGALGFLRAPDQDNPDIVRHLVKETRELTTKPFGVAVVLEFPHEENVRAALDEQVAVLHVAWGEYPRELVEDAHKAGVKVIHQVGSVLEAKKAAAAGVDGIVVQGIEAGGHVMGQTSLMSLLPSVIDAIQGSNIPVIACGGIADARGYVAALALGARGICLGTRFLATFESYAHPLYKSKIVEASESDTEYTNLFGRARWPAPQRVLKSPFFMEWRDKLPANETEKTPGQPVIGKTTSFGQEDVPRFSGKVPNMTTVGQVENMAMYAGCGVGQIKQIISAQDVVQGLVEGARKIIQEQLQGSL
ncbi:hypothetical protein O6H91_06G018800 [Diphasiastrum complanatum]|uniref:Uncharacterized protein n=1 Tax=Diphasiastrum complanatum TaxID=34168 RepID=A0ACC2DBB8_DIPCM|nr:hypothetical protein O6H91_06G018800 [Diphasiastrum complanatum]